MMQVQADFRVREPRKVVVNKEPLNDDDDTLLWTAEDGTDANGFVWRRAFLCSDDAEVNSPEYDGWIVLGVKSTNLVAGEAYYVIREAVE